MSNSDAANTWPDKTNTEEKSSLNHTYSSTTIANYTRPVTFMIKSNNDEI